MWQTKFSTCIYESPSGYKVHQNVFYRWLTLGSDALQTVISRRNPQKPVLYYLPALSLMARKFPNDCCVLGLGGAGVVHLLASYQSDQSIVAVESSDEVIQIAKKYFMVDQINHLTLVHQNAMDYLHECQRSFPHLLVDLYDANHFPEECTNDAFFYQCKNKLTENGFLSVNLANLKEQSYILQLIKKHFKTTLVIPVKKCANMVIIASKNENKEWFIQQIRASGEIKKIVWVENWGYVGE